MSTQSATIETVDVLAETGTYVVAKITSGDAPGITVYNVHLSDDATEEECEQAKGLVPLAAANVEVISLDDDPVTGWKPGWLLVYRQNA